LTTFSDFRCSETAPDFLPIRDYVLYLEEYCSHFDLWKYIELSTRVTKLERCCRPGPGSGGHIVTLAKRDGTTETWSCDAVAICTGLHVAPNIPSVKGIEHVPKVLHSSEFKARKQFGEGTNVVVLGTGETGMDIAHLAITSPTASVTLCHRNGFLCAPKISYY
jgi:dimethylaniline monooxygenase (N-oxide forming)